MPERATSLTAAAGEHFIAFKLSQMGYPAALTRGGSPTIDLMAGNLDGSETVSLQIKTSSGAWREYKRKPENNHWEWPVGHLAKTLNGKSIFYAFVDLKWSGDDENIPDVFIVPSKAVHDAFAETNWSMNVFWILETEKSKYYNNWTPITKLLRT
ncbi:MAG TPA: hypothetical protein PKD64_10380 [Pirellulaceae bacterium]|nr:hypothetical protein [Pirellulaceae bacterium]HMO92588.1 hypothetical protein [Pirellulaceae bacterium]HMP71467.1 hypothetical protein [Pirellulaceae bacterium]